ncbi:ubiquitin-associated protein 1-like [Paramacrobiotus metropolitanus]|uniref:ubiquitin-associated protein 1-like n=1 Tax=Paramacrobiotus metropolitanus TaxID=2943436 RepID=UPI002445A873|nr:ubiquitin-associated protein 1-like [Paramacrobiotus metropolitanus]
MASASNHIHGAHSLLDGLQIRFSDKYRPAKRIVLAPDYVHRTQEDMAAILDLDYNFRLETSVLSNQNSNGNWLSLFKEEDAQMKDSASQENSLAPSSSQHRGPSPSSNKPARPPPPQPHAHSSASAEGTAAVRLSPTSASVTYQQSVPLQPQKVSPQPQIPRPNGATNHSFRVEDFEPNAANPFDAEELKSLNDMEELQRVLQSPH